MKIELTKSQISYLKSLDSKKKKRKFLLDCFIENVEIGESEKIKVKPIIFKDGVFETNDKEAIDFLNKCGFIKSDKPNYSPEEIELVKHNINQREVTEQGSELLKFDMLEENKVDIAIKSFTFFRDEIIERIASFERKNKGIKVVFDEKKFFSIIDADEVENNQSAK